MINTMLHDELSRLDQNLTKLMTYLDSKISKDGKANTFRDFDSRRKIGDAVDKLRPISRLLRLHLNLDDTTLTSVDFYERFNAQFSSERYRKGVDYYIQDGYDGDPVQVTNEKILHEEFMINDCMQSMSLVPINLASNAMKYMLPDQKVEVVLLKTRLRNTITISNDGPKNENLDKLFEEGVRGGNSEMAGMGLGLSHIKSVIDIHDPLLKATFDITQDNDIEYKCNGTLYTRFVVKISYLRAAPAQVVNQFEMDFFKRIPLIIMHNMVDILANLFHITDKLQNVYLRGESSQSVAEYLSNVNSFYLDIEKMQETIKRCLYIRNGYSSANLLGNICPIDIGKFSEKIIKMLSKLKYRDLKVNINSVSRYTRIVDMYSVVYPIMYGLLDLIFSKAENQVDIDINETNIQIYLCDADADGILYNGPLLDAESEAMDRIRGKMYLSILYECGITVEADNECIMINYQNIY